MWHAFKDKEVKSRYWKWYSWVFPYKTINQNKAIWHAFIDKEVKSCYWKWYSWVFPQRSYL